MEVEEKELGEDASVDQPGQIVVREKEPSPIAIEAFFERVRTIGAKKKKMFEWRCAAEKKKAVERNPYPKEGGSGVEKEATKGNPKPISSSANPSCHPHIPPTPATNPTTEKEWVTVRRKTNKNRKQKQPPNPPKNSGVNTGTVIPAVLAIGNTVAATRAILATWWRFPNRRLARPRRSPATSL
ncbi:hypothetical protein RND71_007013 [Anisodus tanguticus]|uniref:Uncharacterized protein n=1 Tax=Anisodus tanguticus TaxID=243964 RepID=A0AAE1SV39_9SOLA|nr:hypothetical protein RND71_007013 [Anisodus tanguticus]